MATLRTSIITRLAPKIRRPLPKDKRGLPIPHIRDLLVRTPRPCRLLDHYYTTLVDDLLYMTYIHTPASEPPKPERTIRLTYDPANPYAKNRINPPVGGSRVGKAAAPPVTPQSVVRLEKIVLHSMVKESLASRSNLLGPIMLFRVLSGETAGGGGLPSAEGVQIVHGRQTVAGWIRPGVPCGVKVELKGPKMYEFLSTLVQFVLPRLRDFNGVVMPLPRKSNTESPSGVGGVVEFGLPPQAMGFFPQVEINLDAYPKSYGMNIHFVTDTQGQGAQNRARALLSGFGVPFVRR